MHLFADTPSSLFHFKFVNFIVYMRPRLIQHLQQHDRQVSMSMGDDVNEDVKQSKFKQIGSFFFFLEESISRKKKKKTEEPSIMEEEKCQDDDTPEDSDCNNGIVQTLNSLDIIQTQVTNGESGPNESEPNESEDEDDVADYGA